MTPSVNQAVLTHIVQALKEGQIRYCESLGSARRSCAS